MQPDVTPDELSAHYTDPDVTQYGRDSVNVQSSNGRSSADVRITLVNADGPQDHLVLPLASEDGTWRLLPLALMSQAQRIPASKEAAVAPAAPIET